MSTIKKAQSISSMLKDLLSKRLPTLQISEELDAAGAKLLISDGSAATGESTIAIRIKAESTPFTNSIGAAQTVYAPMVIQVIEEATAADADVSVVKAAIKAHVDMELAKAAVKQERYLNASGTVPALSQMQASGAVSGSTLKATVAHDVYWPISGQ